MSRSAWIAWWGAVALWCLFVFPLWLVGWGVLHASKHLNRAANLWCDALLGLFP
jgi:hypothetical protein